LAIDKRENEGCGCEGEKTERGWVGEFAELRSRHVVVVSVVYEVLNVKLDFRHILLRMEIKGELNERRAVAKSLGIQKDSKRRGHFAWLWFFISPQDCFRRFGVKS